MHAKWWNFNDKHVKAQINTYASDLKTKKRLSKDDPAYEDRIQKALEGVLNGQCTNYQQVAVNLNVRDTILSTLIIINTSFNPALVIKSEKVAIQQSSNMGMGMSDCDVTQWKMGPTNVWAQDSDGMAARDTEGDDKDKASVLPKWFVFSG